MLESGCESTSSPISTIHLQLQTCREPLIGVQHVFETHCADAPRWRAYFCKLCCAWDEEKTVLPNHLLSNHHRLRYIVSPVRLFA